jgi:hypothetical protein
VSEIVISADLFELLPSVNGRVPLPVAQLNRSPALHVRLSSSSGGDLLPALARVAERSLVAEALLEKYLEGRAGADLRATVDGLGIADGLPTLRRVIAHEIDPILEPELLPIGTALRQLIAAHHPEVLLELEDYRGIRIVFALLDENELNPNGSHTVLSETHIEAIKLRRASLLRQLTIYLRRRSAERSTYGWWRASPREHTLVCTDGSAMKVTVGIGRVARKAYRREWRWPVLPDTFVVEIPVEDYLECASYHVQIGVATGTYIDSATMRVTSDGPTGRTVLLISEDDLQPGHAHLHFTRRISALDSSAQRRSGGVVRVVLRPTFHGALRAGLHISSAAFATLGALALTVGWRSAGLSCLGPGCAVHFAANSPDTNSVVALLLLAPTVALGVVARQEEPDLTKVVQARYRRRLYSTGAALFVAALALALRLQGYALLLILIATTCVAFVALVITGVSAGYSRRSIRRKATPDIGPGRLSRWLLSPLAAEVLLASSCVLVAVGVALLIQRLVVGPHKVSFGAGLGLAALVATTVLIMYARHRHRR